MLQSSISGFILGFVASPTCPSNAEGLRWGSGSGFRPAFLVGLGAVTGDAIILLVVSLGLYPLLQAFPSAQNVLVLIGAAVLMWLGYGAIKEATGVVACEPQSSTSSDTPAASASASSPNGGPFLRGLLITVLNPSTIVWWVGLLSAAQVTSVVATVLFAGAVLTGSLSWFIALAVLLHFGRTYFGDRARRWLLVFSGVVLFAYAGWLVLRLF